MLTLEHGVQDLLAARALDEHIPQIDQPFQASVRPTPSLTNSMATRKGIDADTKSHNNEAESMDTFGLRSDLAFTVHGDPRIHTTHRKVARVPLSDYVLEPDTELCITQQTMAGITRQAIEGMCAADAPEAPGRSASD